VTGKWHFFLGCKDANIIPTVSWLSGQDKRRLRVVHFLGNLLHFYVREPSGIANDRKLVTRVPFLSEDIDYVKGESRHSDFFRQIDT
jgi:hypothetical protein